MGAPEDANGVPAVTLQAGEQWFGAWKRTVFGFLDGIFG